MNKLNRFLKKDISLPQGYCSRAHLQGGGGGLKILSKPKSTILQAPTNIGVQSYLIRAIIIEGKKTNNITMGTT